MKDRWKIAYHYAATWFIIDLLAVIPFDYIQLGSASAEVDANGGSSDVESVQLLKVEGSDVISISSLRGVQDMMTSFKR